MRKNKIKCAASVCRGGVILCLCMIYIILLKNTAKLLVNLNDDKWRKKAYNIKAVAER